MCKLCFHKITLFLRYEITDDEHIAISNAAWSKFYSCAIQYHEAGLKPMGLVSDERTGLITVVKKAGHSFIRPGKAKHLFYFIVRGFSKNSAFIQFFISWNLCFRYYDNSYYNNL